MKPVDPSWEMKRTELTRRALLGFAPMATLPVLESTSETSMFMTLQSPAGSNDPMIFRGPGSDQDSTEEARAALAAAAEAGRDVLFQGEWHINGLLEVPNAITGLLIDSDCIFTQHAASQPIFSRSGGFEDARPVTKLAVAGERVIALDDATDISIGSYVIVYSSSTVPNSSDKIGYLRRIVGKANSTDITMDIAVPRDIRPSTGARVRVLNLAAPLRFHGDGLLRHANPGEPSSEAAVRFTLCDSPELLGVRISGWGGSGVEVSHCLGGTTSANISDLPDGLNGNGFGYGVNLRGATRGHKVGGEIGNCRHAVTTNAGPNLPGLEYYGEPEQNLLSPRTYATSDKALDTHRVGWGNVMVPDVQGSLGGGIQIRADNTSVLFGSINGCSGIGLVVDRAVEVPANIIGLRIEDMRFGTGIILSGPASITDVSILKFGIGIRVDPGGSGSRISGFQLDAYPGSTSTTGILLDTSLAMIVSGHIANVGTGIQETPAAAENQWHMISYEAVQIPEVGNSGWRPQIDARNVRVTNQITARSGAFSQVKIGDVGPSGQAGVLMSQSGPTIWRQSSNSLGSSGSLDVFMRNPSDRTHGSFRVGDAKPRIALSCDSMIRFGAGATSELDSAIGRVGPGVIGVGSGQSFRLGTVTNNQRPNASLAGIGAVIYDSSTRKPLFSDGAVWRDALGNGA